MRILPLCLGGLFLQLGKHRLMLKKEKSPREIILFLQLDDFSIFRDQFQNYLGNMELVMKRCEESNLVLGNHISKKGLEVDQTKIEVIEKHPSATNIKGISIFRGCDVISL